MDQALSGWRFRGLQAGAWVVLAFLFLPLLVVIPVSLSDQSYLSLPRHGLSLQHYDKVFGDPAWRASIGLTAALSAVSALIATVLAGMAAIACWRFRGPGAWALRALVMAPLVVPSIVSALGFYQMWAKLGLLDTYAGVVIANVVQTIPYAFTAVSASLLLLDPQLEKAARNLGATQFGAIWTVVVPATRAGIFSGMLFAFVYAWDEVVVQLFITSRGVRLLPRLIWEGLQDTVDPAIAVIASCLTVLTAVLILAMGWAQNRKK